MATRYFNIRKNTKQQQKANLLFAFFLIVSFIATPLYAQNSDKDLDAIFLNDLKGHSEDFALPSTNIAKWDFFGYIESENYFAISGSAATKNKEIAKTEIRNRLNISYGTIFFYGKAIVDIYFYPIEAKFMNPYDNTIFSIQAKEMYIAGGEKFQFKLGKVAYEWGTADLFSVTNFMTKLDSSEFFSKEKDERSTGIYSLQLKYLFGDYSVELVATPDFLVPIAPKQTGFWGLHIQDQKINLFPLPSQNVPVEMDVPKRFSQFSYKNFSAAFRIGGSSKGVDFHFSYFNGFNNTLVFVPKLKMKAPMLIEKILMQPLYERINKIGFDMATSYKRFSFRFEAAFTPDYVAISSNKTNVDTNFRRKTMRIPYGALSIGSDINFHGSHGRIFLEYATGFFLKDQKKYEKELFTDFLFIGIEDKVAAQRLLLRAAVIVHTTNKKPGVMPLAHIEYNFDNGLSLAMGVQIFIAQNDELMTWYKTKDIFYVRARYNF